jgi:hypothetical protein
VILQNFTQPSPGFFRSPLSVRALLINQHSRNRPAASAISAPGKASDLQLAKAPIKMATIVMAAPMSSHFQATPSPASETIIVVRLM